MKNQLTILTGTSDDLARKITQIQQDDQVANVNVVDLTRPNPDYSQLVREIFASDSVQIW